MDRNGHACTSHPLKATSLSARRAWIEILTDDVSTGGKIVALRKESVDRNFLDDVSLNYKEVVALRKESVDRNILSQQRIE